ncbi:TonB-dependent receptor [Oceanihabitans sediminis]|uniref:TonB-dependent receptor n=1 Tax=Oceanihabitans sediminis TaxID=1812012 RepID=UPI003A92A1FE
MIKKITILFFLLFVAFSAFSQKSSGVISGKIIDEQGNLSLPGATVILDSGERYTISNQIGHYEFLNVPEGTYRVTVQYIGFVSHTLEAKVEIGKNTKLDFIMSSDLLSLDEVVITGERLKGQAKALNQQKNNQNITNVISSDQVGRFADANVGDALKRVPGITVQNDQGEARNLIIRGLAPELNSVTLNGDRIPSAEGDNRNVQMDLIPSDMISTIEVNKTLTPDMDADAIGGSVNLITRASPNGQRISATLAGGYAPIREKGNYTAGLVYGNRFFDNKLGAVFSASYNNNNFGSDNIEAEWKEGEKGQVYIGEKDIRKYDVQRVRRSFALALDYNLDSNNTLFLNSMYNWRDDRENRYRVRYRKIKPVYDDQDNITGFTGDIRRETKGGIDNNRNKNTRLEDQRVQNYSIGGQHLINAKLDLDWQVNYATASEDRPNERYLSFQSKGLDLSQDLSDLNFPLVNASGDGLDTFKVNQLSENHNFTEEKEIGAKVNIRIPFSVIDGQKGRLRTGLRLRIKEKKRDNIFYEYEPITSFGTLADLPISYYGGGNWEAGPNDFPGFFVDKSFLGNLNLTNTSLFEGELDPSEYLSENYKAKERISAAYLRWDQDLSDKFSIITGVRVEHTNIDYTGNYVKEEEELVGQISNTNSYTDILPSLAIKYDIQNDLILRAAVSTALARPNYYSLAPYVNVNTEDNEISAGNPELDATNAINFDLMVDKYFKSVGILSGGVFYKNMKNFIYTASDSQYTQEKFASDFPNQSNPISNGETWDFVQSRNGDNVGVYGFEVALQRQLDFIPVDFFKSLGVYVNYTFTKSKTKGITNEDGEEREGIDLPGTAPHMLNASLSWDNDKFSIRVSSNYSSDYIDELGGNEFEDRYYDKQFFLDANASYKISENLRVFAEANNLTNQPLRYYQGVSERTMQAEYYLPKFNLGLKFDL